MIIGKYPGAMNPQLLAEIYSRLLNNVLSKKIAPTRLEPHPLPYYRGDNRWQLDEANTYWIRINANDSRYTLMCYNDSDTLLLDELKRKFETHYLKRK